MLERGASSVNSRTRRESMPIEALIAADFQANKLYRYFKQERHARALCQGDVWVSTLEECRKHEERGRRDELEGASQWRVKEFNSPSGLKAQELIKQQFGGVFKDCTVYGFEAAFAFDSMLPDAYVICTTDSRAESTQETFGDYCVEISNPRRFFELVTIRLFARTNDRISRSMLSPVTYSSIEYWDDALPLAPPGLVKRPETFGSQREVRLLWYPQTVPISPLLLTVPGVGRLCRLVNDGSEASGDAYKSEKSEPARG